MIATLAIIFTKKDATEKNLEKTAERFNIFFLLHKNPSLVLGRQDRTRFILTFSLR